MGRSKAFLPFGPECMLQRIVRVVREAAPRVVAVAARGQELPDLPSDVRVAFDQRQGRGPLEGLLAGLASLGEGCEAAFATSCDAPFLSPAFVRGMLDLLGDSDIVVPHVENRYHPLAAVYRRAIVPAIETLLAADRLRPAFLFEQVRTREVTADDLRAFDPNLCAFRNLNHPQDYLAALAEAGFTPPPEALETMGE